MNFTLYENVKDLKLPAKYLKAKKNAWDRRVEKTAFIATGETSKA
jgi:hypothetical protein